MKKQRPLTRGERVIAFIHKYCRVPEGKLVGQPIKLMPFQEAFLKEIYDNPHGTHTAVLSIARKNGKTALIACILIAHIAGPEAVLNSQIVSGAMSRDQASIVFNLAVKIINLSPELSSRIRIFPSGKRLLGISKNVEYKALAADGKTAHGLSPILAILDELGQVEGPTDPFIEAVETAQGAYDNPLKIIISTQARTDNDMLSLIIDAPDDPHIVKHIYRAPEEASLEDPRTWEIANPALGVFNSLSNIKKHLAKALAIPSFEPSFRNLICNMRVEAIAPFVTKTTWLANGAVPDEAKGKKIWAGLDLSQVKDLTALVLVDEDGGVHCKFWLPEFGLKERVREDRVPYDLWVKQGFLTLTPGKAVDYRMVAAEMKQVFAKYDVQGVGFDRWRIDMLKPWLAMEGLTDVDIDKFRDFGQGHASMTPALDALEVKLLNEQLKHGENPILTMCASNVKVDTSGGGKKFDKRKYRGRIDGMVALAMAVGVMPHASTEETKRTWDDYLADMAGA